MNTERETILIVDDSRLQRSVFRKMLQPRFRVLEAESGEECIQILRERGNQVHAVLLDLVMPGMDGFQVLEQRRELDFFMNIPVIILTSGNSKAMQIRAFELGANDFLNKPGEEAIVLSRLQNVLESGRRFRALVEQRNQMRYRAELDEMTGLLNKMTARQFIQKHLESMPEESVALFIVDIDNFKAINDIHGHEMGDHTIRIMANILSSCFRKSDIVGRLGGDEFCVLMKNIPSRQEVRRRAEKLLQMIRKHENQTLPENITISIGISYSSPECRLEELLSEADQALYLSKKAGKDCYTEYGCGCCQDGSIQCRSRALLLSRTRSVISTLHYSCSSYYKLSVVETVAELETQLREDPEGVSRIFLDVSAEEGDGLQVWSAVTGKEWAKRQPLVAICREGDIPQLRTALDTGLIADLYFAPVNDQFVDRRLRGYMKEKAQQVML